MFGYSTITAVLFRFINSAILFGAGWYLYKKYAQEMLEEQVGDKLSFIAGLKQQKNVLASTEKELQTDLEKQQQACAQIKQKVVYWQDDIAQKVKKREEERKHIAQAATKRTDRQNNYLLQKKVLQEAVPQALGKAQDTLRQNFLDKEKNQQFIDTIIAQLEKRT